MKHKNLKFVVLFFFLISYNISYSQIGDANKAYNSYNLKEATELYLKVFKNTNANIDDRVLAGKRLSYFSWHFHKNIEDARKYANASLQLNKDRSKILNSLAKYEAKAENFTKAREASEKAIENAETENEKLTAHTNYTNVVLQEAIYQVNNSQGVNTDLIEDALNKIEVVNTKEPGQIISAEIQLGLALLLKDGKNAYQSWRNYFRIPKGNDAKGILEEPEKKLKSVLLTWQADELDIHKRNQLIIGLADSRFYHFADLLIKYLPNTNNKETNKVKDIIAYWDFCVKIEKHTYEIYRNMAFGNETSKMKKESKKLQKQFWENLFWENKHPRFKTSNFADEIFKRFGTKFILKGSVNGYWCFLGGHSVVDDKRTVEQYGYSETIRYISLDFMIANDFTGWFLGYFRVGGWAKKDAIIQVRSSYASKPVKIWRKLTDEKLLKEWQDEIIKESAKDDSLALKNPHTFLPGLSSRMKYKACNRLLDSLKAQGFKDNELRMNFISSYESINVNSSIFAHEGRHVIDKNIGNFTGQKLEFRAKLSEIFFTQFPFLAISSIFIENIGQNHAHGQANEQIVINLVKWMDNNKNEIKDFDTGRPTLPQLDLLTPEQLKKAVQSMEPFLLN